MCSCTTTITTTQTVASPAYNLFEKKPKLVHGLGRHLNENTSKKKLDQKNPLESNQIVIKRTPREELGIVMARVAQHIAMGAFCGGFLVKGKYAVLRMGALCGCFSLVQIGIDEVAHLFSKRNYQKIIHATITRGAVKQTVDTAFILFLFLKQNVFVGNLKGKIILVIGSLFKNVGDMHMYRKKLHQIGKWQESELPSCYLASFFKVGDSLKVHEEKASRASVEETTSNQNKDDDYNSSIPSSLEEEID